MDNKVKYITLLNVISAFSVVILHSNGCFWSFAKEPYWIRANIIECVFYFAVPIFFMISGATLMDYRERYTTKDYFVKRIKKTVIPFLAWSMIGLVYFLLKPENDGYVVNLKTVLDGILGTKYISIYWFFPPLFCVYMSIPLFSAINKDKRKGLFSYLAIICFVVNVMIPFLIKVTGFEIGWPFSVAVGSGYLFYVIVGYLLNEYDINKYLCVSAYILAIIGLIMHILGTYLLSMKDGAINSTYKGYVNVPCILYSIGIFLLIKNYGEGIMSSFIGKIVNIVSKYTFGIYLVHWYVLDIISFQFKIDKTQLAWQLGAVVLVVPVVMVIIWILRKVPFLRCIVP